MKFADGPLLFESEAKEGVAEVGFMGADQFAAEPSVLAGVEVDLLDAGEGGEAGGEVGGAFDFKGEALVGGFSFEGGGWVGGDHPAFMEDEDAVADGIDFGKEVGGEEDGVARGEGLDEGADLAHLVGIESDGGFVEDEDIGIVDEGLGEADALAVALGELADEA